jgi:hypothetical protein
MTRVGLSTGSGGSAAVSGDYMPDIVDNADLKMMVSFINDLVETTEDKCDKLRVKFGKYSDLWTQGSGGGIVGVEGGGGDEEIDSVVLSFVNTNAVQMKFDSFIDTTTGLKWSEIMSMIGIDVVRMSMVDLVQMSIELDKLATMKTEISEVRNPVDIDWIRINVNGLKTQLTQIIEKYESKYFEYIQCKLEECIGIVGDFMRRVSIGFGAESARERYDTDEKYLYHVMTNIKDVRLSAEAIRLLFGPIKDIVNFLRRYGQNVDDGKISFLDQLNVRWDEIVKSAFNEKERILPYQNREMDKIKGRIGAFIGEVAAYRQKFLSENPFSFRL